MISAVSWIPRGAVKRVPIKQELSADELAQVREAAAAEAAAEAAAGHRGEEEEGEEAAKGGAARQAVAAAAAAAALGGPKAARRTGRPDPLADPAFASLRGVQLPFDMDEDEDASASDSASSEGGGDGAPAGRQRRDAARARAQATLDRAVLGQRMADIDAPAAFDDEEEEPEDEEDLVAAPGDCFLLAATSEEEHSALEVHVYNVEDGSLYVHHDITLPALPLCLAWMDYAGSAAAAAASAQRALFSGGAPPTGGDETVGSYVAVGTFKPDIEIWNADVLDPLEPSLVLRGAGAGGAGGGAGGGRRGAPRASALATATAPGSTAGHGDAVLGLSWNRAHRHLLASGSADSSVKVWDLDAARGAGGVLHTYTHHKGKVQSVAWNPAEASVLAAASYDRTLSVTDARAPDKSRIARYSLPSDPEALAWGAHNPAQLLVGCEDGALLSYDVRSPDTPLWHLPAAHTGALTCIAQSLLARGLVATGGLDKSVKLWDTLAAGAGAPAAPACIAGKVMSIGQIFSISFFPTSPFLLAAGGSKGMVAVWDIEADGGQPASGAASAPAPSSSSSSDAHLLGADASETARRFAGRMVTDPASVPGNPLAIRARVDGQAMA